MTLLEISAYVQVVQALLLELKQIWALNFMLNFSFTFSLMTVQWQVFGARICL